MMMTSASTFFAPMLFAILQVTTFIHKISLSHSYTTYAVGVLNTRQPLSSSSPLSFNRNNQRQRQHLQLLQLEASTNENDDTRIISSEAQQLLAKAKKIRDSLEQEKGENDNKTEKTSTASVATSNDNVILSPFNVATDDNDISNTSFSSVGYRLNIDIGREDGTWMDPRWGASGKRIEFTMDISFLMPTSSLIDPSKAAASTTDSSLASEDVCNNMVKDNLSGKSSEVRFVHSAAKARLRNGFDQMNAYGGGYRIDAGSSGSSNTLRFYINVDGTEGEGGVSYGDISVPKGNLYFSLPCFGNNAKQLSTKEGIISVKQIGWHTGWRREESRIVGVFRAVPIDQAKRRDRY